MFCKACGHEIPNDAAFCPSCGAPVNGTNTAETATPNIPPAGGQYGYVPPIPPMTPVSYEDADTLLKVASFFIPMVGIILYAIDRDKKPVSAKACLKMGIAGIITWVAVPFLIWLFAVLLIFGVGVFAAA